MLQVQSNTSASDAWAALEHAIHMSDSTRFLFDIILGEAKKEPGFANPWINIGILMIVTRDWSGAIKAFQTALSIVPASCTAMVLLGIALHASGDKPGAVDVWKKTVESDPNQGDAWNHVAKAYLESQRWRDAILACEQAAKHESSRAIALSMLGIAYYKEGEKEKARECIHQSFIFTPRDSEVLYNIATFHALTGSIDASIRFLDVLCDETFLKDYNVTKLLDRIANDSNLDNLKKDKRYSTFLSHHEEKSIDVDIQYIEKVKKILDVKHAGVQDTAQAGDAGPGINNENKTTLIEGIDRIARLGMKEMAHLENEIFWLAWAIALENLGETHRAVICHQVILEMHPEMFYAWFNVGLMYWKDGLLDTAEKYFRVAIEKDPTAEHGWSALGCVLTEKEQFKEAEECYRTALSINPEFSIAKQALDKHVARKGQVVMETGASTCQAYERELPIKQESSAILPPAAGVETSRIKKYVLKVLCVGDSDCGKQGILHRYVSNRFITDSSMTVGVEFHLKNIAYGGIDITLQIWDFKGQDRFRFLLPTYASGSKGFIMFFNLDKPSTVLDLESSWLPIARKEDPKSPGILMGIREENAAQSNHPVDPEFGREFEKDHNLQGYFEVSVNDGAGVDAAFKAIVKVILDYLGIPYDSKLNST